MSRLLVLSASMGSGHDAVAGELGRRLHDAGHQAVQLDVLDMLPARIGPLLRAFYRSTVRHTPFVYAAIYAVFFRNGSGPRPGSSPLAVLAEDRLRQEVTRTRADAVVAVFHLAAQLTGRMRATGGLRVPSAVVVTDFVAHRQWLHPGNDLNLCLTPAIAREMRQTLRRPAVACGPLLPHRFRPHPPGEERWRRSLATADGRPAVLLSAGAWGVGSRLAETAHLLSAAGYLPVVLCGQDRRLAARLAREPGVRALGWVDDMPGLIAACAALIDNAAGQTALEALAVGTPVVGYRPIPGHGAEGVRSMAAHGLSHYAADPWQLLQRLDQLTIRRPAADGAPGGNRLVPGDVVGPLAGLVSAQGH
ncbi:MGDG synthase family glycosyltransferase [Actinacidiphila acidipaludis]|uniref:MGDG synthase family glycosyltransferase n=1 Tax=Actinacidiphila acidipaludis TaxID=2873382 RepID=UPI0027DEB627|nr:galactosyldiacylglycerol synthase [Streptomyces acidipaludis]